MNGRTRLPLFPLRTVLFPGGLLSLKVFEARYLDLVSTCLREGTGFGVVALTEGTEVQHASQGVTFEAVGCLARVLEVDAEQPGILQVRCQGGERFRGSAVSQAGNGLWSAEAGLLPGDAALAPPPELVDATRSLANAIGALARQGTRPFLEPYRFDDAGWVANRWCACGWSTNTCATRGWCRPERRGAAAQPPALPSSRRSGAGRATASSAS